MRTLRGWTLFQYIFFDLLPTFLMGLGVFVFIILMVQVLRMTEFVLIHGVDFRTILQVLGYLSVSFLPALLPMSLLFSVILTYGRMSSDSEVVAMKSIGLTQLQLTFPAFLLAMIVAAISAEISFNLAPWGNRQFEVLITKIGNSKAAATIREGTFSESFFDLVIYANKVDSKKGLLEHLFIYDEKPGEIPLTIIAKSGELIQDPKYPGHLALLRLKDGDIHRKGETHTKIKFDTYDIRLFDPIKESMREKSPQSFTLDDLRKSLADPQISPELHLNLLTEWHKRWGVAAICVIFALLGVGLGTVTNRRTSKSSGMVLCIGVIIAFWILYIAGETMARSGQVPVVLAIWFPAVIFGLAAGWSLKSAWN